MGVIDWTIIAFLLVLTYFGLKCGLVGAIVQFAGVILNFFLIGHYYPLLANRLVLKFGLSKTLSVMISVVLILVLVVVVTRFVIWILNRFIKVLNLGWMNRLLGAILGLLNGLILVIVFTLVMDYMPKAAKALNNPDKHRVYVGMNTLKDDAISHIKLKNYSDYLKKMPELIKKQDKSTE
ncbi:MAG: CvpA family protein [Candidatus Cloacimonetes bacterium]|jgi:membrane protein required for colicin V production|nr:CvpA family protein [Candidatus Cloacimonadota bacterium]MCB5287239.1 CvpA family protein [Candidatus Cloacimonadota bacterium]MCK9184792.1 CvpA family protein [Candidatus Cloacimonadota bacterium]MCK9583766.1 CvpA family protein [Candidatus Cloacimonadota bacterium]MDY0229561.1 CvpA family protein [Candidatus Cloacimonadaceae bacterium]